MENNKKLSVLERIEEIIRINKECNPDNIIDIIKRARVYKNLDINMEVLEETKDIIDWKTFFQVKGNEFSPFCFWDFKYIINEKVRQYGNSHKIHNMQDIDVFQINYNGEKELKKECILKYDDMILTINYAILEFGVKLLIPDADGIYSEYSRIFKYAELEELYHANTNDLEKAIDICKHFMIAIANYKRFSKYNFYYYKRYSFSTPVYEGRDNVIDFYIHDDVTYDHRCSVYLNNLRINKNFPSLEAAMEYVENIKGIHNITISIEGMSNTDDQE